MTFVMTTLALSAFAIAPSSAQSSGSWSLDCKGNGSAAVSWTWLLDGTPISGAGGSASCGSTMTLNGGSATPSTANGLTVVLTVTAGKVVSKTTTKSFAPGTSVSVQLTGSASQSGWFEFCYPDLRECVRSHFHDDEGAQFSLQA